MSNSFSFGTSGSTPGVSSPLSAGTLNLGGSTPQAKALNGVISGSTPSVASNVKPITGTPASPATSQSSMPGFLTPGHPALASQTVNNVDGSSTTQKYNTATVAPAETQNDAIATVNPNAPIVNQNAPQGTPIVQPTPTPNTNQNGNIVGQLQTTSANSSPAATAAEQATAAAAQLNPALAQNAENIGNNYGAQIAQTVQAANQGGVGMLTSGALNPVALGRSNAIETAASQQEQGLAAAENAALSGNAQGLTAASQEANAETQAGQLANTQQGQIQSGLSEAGSLANNLVSSPYGSPLVNPASGQAYSGGQALSPSGSGSNGAIQPGDPAYASLQQYAQLAANGEGSQIPSAWTSNPVINAQLNSMAAQINPNYNPLTTPLNTTTQASANATIGSTNQEAAAATQQAISRIANITSSTNNFLTQWGLNQTDSPFYNQPINTFLSSNAGAGAEASWNLITSDLTAATSQLMSTPGITPTGFTSELSSFNPTNLSPSELDTYLSALSDAGQYQLNSYQTTASGAYDSNSSNLNSAPQPYAGAPTSATPPALPTPADPSAVQAENAPSVGKLIGGAALGLMKDVSGILGGLAGYASSLF